MARTTEHIGKVALMVGNDLTQFIGGASPENFANAGLTCIGLIQPSHNGVMYTFAEIIGECDPDIFTKILTKKEVNEMILSFFKPSLFVTHERERI